MSEEDQNELLNMVGNMHSRNSTGTSHIVRYIIVRPPVTLEDVIPFVVGFSIYCLVIHFVLILIKKMHKPTYNALVLFFIVIFPPIIMIMFRDILFISLWACLMIFFAYCLRIGFNKGLLARNNPKKIYRLFKKVFTITNSLLLISQILVIFSFMMYDRILQFSLRSIIYSLYFAVFCREVMFMLSRIMAMTTGYYSKESTSIGVLKEDKNLCMICCESLTNKKKIFTNTCGHSFHMECIKGWALLANNLFCIYCKKGITEIDPLTKDLWYKAEHMMRPLMNFLRSSISFFVVIYVIMAVNVKKQ